MLQASRGRASRGRASRGRASRGRAVCSLLKEIKTELRGVDQTNLCQSLRFSYSQLSAYLAQTLTSLRGRQTSGYLSWWEDVVELGINMGKLKSS